MIFKLDDDDQTMGRQSVKNEEQLQLYIIPCETTSVAKIQVENGSITVG